MLDEKKLFIKIHNIQRETLLFSCEYCVTFKNTYFEENLRTVASEKEALISTYKILKFYYVLRYDGIFSIFFPLILY